MIGEFQKEKDGTFTVSVKLQASQVELLNAICNLLGVNSYQIFQMFFYTLMRASAPIHELSPEIRKLMTLMECDAGWANAFNLANPNDLEVAQAILILQQKDKKGFGAVMVDKPFFGDATMTECVDDILERVTDVCVHGIYRRLQAMKAHLDCKSMIDLLLTMIDEQAIIELEEQNRVEMKGEPMYHNGRRIEYGKKAKSHGRRTPDSVDADQRVKQQTITFDDYDRHVAEEEAKR